MSDTNLAEDIPEPAPVARGDMTQGPILRTLVAFAIPALVANVLQTVGGSINAIWVGQLLGTTAIAATANASMIMFLVFGAVFGFGMATTIRVGHHIGSRDLAGARRNFGGGLGFCTALAVAIAGFGWGFAEQVLDLMATPEESKAPALAYLRITFLAVPFSTLSMMISMGLRGAGDATTPMVGILLTVVLGTLLNPLLILGWGPIPTLGIAGSALAGVIASLAGTTLMIVTIYRRDLPLRLRGAEFAYLVPDREEFAYIVTKGLPMGAQTLLSTAAGLIMVGLVNREGILATAAYGASLQLWYYVQMPALAVGTAVSTMVAQNLGAGRSDRIGEITGAGLAVAMVITALPIALIVLFDRPVLGLFLGMGSAAIPLALHIQLICSWSFMLMGVTMVLFSTMRAYGAVMTPLIIMFVALYPARLGFYQLAYPVIGTEAVWWSYPVSSVAAIVLTVLFYRYGAWRRTRPKASAEVAPDWPSPDAPAAF